MIFVILGTQDKPFTRLLEAVEKQIENGNITEEVIVQAGFTKFKSSKMKIYDLISQEDFSKFITEASLIITHGGVGSILTALKNNKKVIAAARLAKYGEHVNDHQVQIVKNFERANYILPLYDFDKLDEVLLKAKNFTPDKYQSNNQSFVNLIEKLIEN